MHLVTRLNALRGPAIRGRRENLSSTHLAGLVFDDRYLQHNPGVQTLWSTSGPIPFVEPVIHPSNYRLAMRTKHLIDLSGLGKQLARIDPYPAAIDDITVYHTPEYVEFVRELCESGGGETGEGAPAGPESYDVALLAAGGGMAAVDAAYLAAFEQIVLPIANEFRPQLVLVSAGQDASTMDTLGRMCLTTEGYRRMTQAMIDVAETHADGRLVILQEGGYSELYAPYCTLAIVETLAGTRTGQPEPLLVENLALQPQYHTVGASAEARISEIRPAYAPYWLSLRNEA